jgi:hypothetical protein
MTRHCLPRMRNGTELPAFVPANEVTWRHLGVSATDNAILPCERTYEPADGA